ncbi:hypothetical protein FisN_2Hh138 [Fistulifera solaris]|uniref:Uncharacterized protein n=1 Tax=Fistulifera solaris TaxID=1519565 RepID=A0A1Z5KNZ2_FISSO|nr:hypothetical protein FisN_2Hh138 [Fistulifera solaris]|eukprot:GAX28044.1 hypothetical protein FisN_2Hh138 [Fistulifera solaris]
MTAFDFELFPIYVAAQLLKIDDDLLKDDETIHWYWRSSSSSWIDAAWEMQRHQPTVWKLGCLYATDGGGVYVQSDALTETDIRHFFESKLAILVDQSSTYSLAHMFAQALQHPSSSSSSENAINLYFADLQMTAAFPLVRGRRTEVPPILFSRLHYTGPGPPPDSPQEEDVRRAVQTWKSQSLKPNPKILSPSPEKHASPGNQKKPVRNKLVKVPTRKPGLKFKGQG